MIDPFLTGNPSFKGDPKQAAAGATHVLVTHGHNDHVGDAISICKEGGAMLVCIGPKTAKVAREVGLEVGLVADETTSDGIIRALVDQFGDKA